MNAVNTLVSKIVDVIILPLVGLVFAVAVVVFIWGVVSMMINSDDPAKHEQGRNHVIWGVVGIAVMISVFGIIRFVAQTVGQGNNIGF